MSPFEDPARATQLLPVRAVFYPPIVKAQLSKVPALSGLTAFSLLHPRRRDLALGTVAPAPVFPLIHGVPRRPTEHSYVGTGPLESFPDSFVPRHSHATLLLAASDISPSISALLDHPGHTRC